MHRLIPDRIARVAAAAASGACFVLASAPWDLWPLAWVGFAALLWAADGQPPRRALLLGWVSGLVSQAGGYYWIEGLLVRFGHLPHLAAVPLFALLVAYQALTFAAFAWAFAWVRARLPVPAALLAPVALTACEFATPMLFPYYVAISQAWRTPVIQVAEIGGPSAVTFLVLMVNGAVYDLLRGGRAAWRPAAAAAAVMAAALAFGHARVARVDARRAQAPRVRVGVVQANVGIRAEARRHAGATHNLHLRVSRELERRGAELIVWPESSYPYWFYRDMQRDWPPGDRKRVMNGLRTPVLLNSLTLPRAGRPPYNTALLIDADGRIAGRFDKNVLLLFGEYVPLYEELGVERWLPAASNFARGTEVAAFPFRSPRDGRAWKLAPLICYEDIIPSFVRRYLPHEPNLLVNITNDAWFGRTSEPWQHLALSVFRAVEHRLDLVRAVNTGVSAVIDAAGRVRARTSSVDPRETPDAPPETLLEEVAMLDGAGWYGTLGDAFAWADVGAFAALVALAWRRSRRTG